MNAATMTLASGPAKIIACGWRRAGFAVVLRRTGLVLL